MSYRPENGGWGSEPASIYYGCLPPGNHKLGLLEQVLPTRCGPDHQDRSERNILVGRSGHGSRKRGEGPAAPDGKIVCILHDILLIGVRIGAAQFPEIAGLSSTAPSAPKTLEEPGRGLVVNDPVAVISRSRFGRLFQTCWTT